jgi:hypothetical protein
MSFNALMRFIIVFRAKKLKEKMKEKKERESRLRHGGGVQLAGGDDGSDGGDDAASDSGSGDDDDDDAESGSERARPSENVDEYGNPLSGSGLPCPLPFAIRHAFRTQFWGVRSRQRR